MKTQLPPLTENQVKDVITQYLRTKGYYVQRLNSGLVPVVNKYGKRHMVQLAPAGTPDIMAFRGVLIRMSPAHQVLTKQLQLLFIEVKRSPKHKPTPLQLAKMEELSEYGARCIVASSIDDLQRAGI
jgi:hypothetical protein